MSVQAKEVRANTEKPMWGGLGNQTYCSHAYRRVNKDAVSVCGGKAELRYSSVLRFVSARV